MSLSKLIRSIASRPRKRRFGWYPTNLSIAFLSMQIIADPKIGYTIEQHFVLQDDEEDEDPGGLEDPIAHLHRQAKMIRNGIPFGHLTARLPPRLCAVFPSPASKQ